MKKVAFIVYSDIHHNVWNQFNEGDRRIKETINVQKEIYLAAKKYKAPKLFIGDLLHNEKYITNKLLSYLLPHFKKIWGSEHNMTYAISGNHDQSEQNTPDYKSPSYIETFATIFPGLNCLDFKSETVGKITIHGIPYLTHDTGLLASIKKIKRNTKGKNILMLHTTLPDTVDTDGRSIETITIGNKVMRSLSKFDLVLVGHIHKPMKLKKNILQIGASSQQRKTDKDCDLGYWIIYEDLSYEFRPTKHPKFIELPYGEEKPDNKNFYYNKEKVIERKTFEVKSEKFSDVTNRNLIAKSYLKEKGIKDKQKKEALINTLKNVE